MNNYRSIVRQQHSADNFATHHVTSCWRIVKLMLFTCLAVFGAVSQEGIASAKNIDSDGRGKKNLHAKQPNGKIGDRAAKAATPYTLPRVVNESELTSLITSSRARLALSSHDTRALDALGWAGITLAEWALEAEAAGNPVVLQGLLDRIQVDLHDVGGRIQTLAERGWFGGWSAVGLLRARGLLLEKDERRACEAYNRAATTSPASKWHAAQCRLGDDAVQAWLMIEESARAGHAGAQEWMARRCLGEFTDTGGSDKDPVCAREWLVQAASQGRPSAQTLLAYLMITGSGGAVDVPRGMNLYRQAAHKGDVVAQNNLGERYETGRLVEKDLNEALNWYERAARSGLPAAQFNAGRLLAVGVDGRRDLDLARKWLLNAKEQGIAEADSVILWIDGQQPAKPEVTPHSSSGSGISRSLPRPGLR
jgi:hypothetical protein